MGIKKIFSLLLVCVFSSFCFMLCGFSFFKKKPEKVQTINAQTVESHDMTGDKLWCVTFQLVWNEFMQKITNGEPIQFVGGNPPIVDELNKQNYTKDNTTTSLYTFTKNNKYYRSLT